MRRSRGMIRRVRVSRTDGAEAFGPPVAGRRGLLAGAGERVGCSKGSSGTARPVERRSRSVVGRLRGARSFSA